MGEGWFNRSTGKISRSEIDIIEKRIEWSVSMLRDRGPPRLDRVRVIKYWRVIGWRDWRSYIAPLRSWSGPSVSRWSFRSTNRLTRSICPCVLPPRRIENSSRHELPQLCFENRVDDNNQLTIDPWIREFRREKKISFFRFKRIKAAETHIPLRRLAIESHDYHACKRRPCMRGNTPIASRSLMLAILCV